jgi:hypothetical protein
MFVGTLFNFLESRGISRREIVKRLGSDRSSTWLWAQGKRGIAKAYQRPFLAMVAQAIREMSPEQYYELWQMLGEWDREVAEQSGELTARAQRAGEILAETAHLDLTKCTQAELDRYMWAHKEGQRAIRVLTTRRGFTLGSDLDFQGGTVPDLSQTPMDRFREICRWHGVELETSA